MKRKVVDVNHPVVQKKIDRSLKLSVKEGAFASVATSFSLSYFAPFALVLNATAAQMGILYAVISLLPSLVQLKATNLIDRFSRKGIVVSGTVGRLLLVPLFLLTAFLFYIGVPYMVWVLILLVGLHYTFSGISYPAWFSWMGSLVPKENRGKYFSKRNRIIGLAGMISMIAGAIALDKAKSFGTLHGDALAFTLIGFGALFFLSAVFRLWSWALLKKEYEPRIKIRKKDHFSLLEFLKKCRETPFGRFSLFGGAFAFAVGISTPFWAVYMLRDLGFSYFWYMAITVSIIVFQIVFLPLLGKFSDRFGNVKLIRMCSLFAGIVPFLWIASSWIESDLGTKFYLLIVPAIVGGFGWAGYNLALNNYIYDAVRTEKRAFGLSYMNLLIGLGGFIGAGIGAIIAWINISFMNSMLFIFGISGAVRLFVAVYGSKYLHEIRSVRKFAPEFLLREFTPAQNVMRQVYHLEHLVEDAEHYIEAEDEKWFGEKI